MKKRFKSKRSKKHNKNILSKIIILFVLFYFGKVCFPQMFDFVYNMSILDIRNEEKRILEKYNIDVVSPKNIIYSSLNKLMSKADLTVFNDIYEENPTFDDEITNYIEDTTNISYDYPIVYIYNTHQLEEYNSNMIYDYSIKPNVMIASYILKEKLAEYDIPSVVETGNIKEYLNSNNLKYSYSYEASRYFINKANNEYKTLKYYIDLHRDSALKDKTLLELNGKKYARCMFVVGLEHENYQENLDLALKLNNIIEQKYPDLSRGVLRKKGPNVNGIYNQDLSPNSVLIEVGGVENTIDEVYNTIEVIAETINTYLKGESK